MDDLPLTYLGMKKKSQQPLDRYVPLSTCHTEKVLIKETLQVPCWLFSPSNTRGDLGKQKRNNEIKGELEWKIPEHQVGTVCVLTARISLYTDRLPAVCKINVPYRKTVGLFSCPAVNKTAVHASVWNL